MQSVGLHVHVIIFIARMLYFSLLCGCYLYAEKVPVCLSHFNKIYLLTWCNLKHLLLVVTLLCPVSLLAAVFDVCWIFRDVELRRRAELSYLGVKYAGMLPDNICRPGRQYNQRVVARQSEFISDLRRCCQCRKFCYFSMVCLPLSYFMVSFWISILVERYFTTVPMPACLNLT